MAKPLLTKPGACWLFITLAFPGTIVDSIGVVQVSDYLPLWNATEGGATTKLSFQPTPMNDIYDVSNLHCPGDPAFISNPNAAPKTFCMSGIAPNDLRRVVGSEWWWAWKSDVVQKWANAARPTYDINYDHALARQVEEHGMPLKYDQFASERILLGKWASYAQTQSCTGRHRPPPCKRGKPDVVVVPSLLAHMQHLLWGGHFAWNLLLPKECVSSEGAGAALPLMCLEGFGSLEVHRRFWSLVRKTHHAPYLAKRAAASPAAEVHQQRQQPRERSLSSTASLATAPAPLIVVHHSFVWDQPAFLHVLNALLEQPKAFVERVVLVSIEANLKTTPGLGGPSGPRSGPLIVAVPYPTGLGVETVASFAPPLFPVARPSSAAADTDVASEQHGDGSATASAAAAAAQHAGGSAGYDPWKARPILVLLAASLDRKGGGGKVAGTNWVRPLVHSHLVSKGASCAGDVCALCRRHGNSSSSAPGTADGGSSGHAGPCQGSGAKASPTSNPTMWEYLVSSTFCLEPAGDTLTRSHLYAALLSGCVPVILDGGVKDFDNSEPTWWAWRGSSGGDGGGGDGGDGERKSDDKDNAEDGGGSRLNELRYRDFAVVVNASAVRSGERDLIQELLSMPPDRLLALRRNVDKAAQVMRYARDPAATDAFTALRAAITASAQKKSHRIADTPRDTPHPGH